MKSNRTPANPVQSEPKNAGSLSNPDNLMIAGRHGGGYFAEGAMDDFRIYDRALLEGEIQALYDE